MNDHRYPVPSYFDFLIQDFHEGMGNRMVHLGHWDQPTATQQVNGASFAAAQKALEQELIRIGQLEDGLSVLDVGCGFGSTLQTIDSQFAHMQLLGLNIDPRQIAICEQIKATGHNTLSWQQGDACSMPFPDQCFDRIFCIEAMFHFRSRQKFFNEVARLLKPNGLLIASDIACTKTVDHQSIPGFAIEAALLDGYGPWPDLWGDEGSHSVMASKSGLKLETFRDVSKETMPSHQLTVSSRADGRKDPGNAAQRAAMMLKWLQQQDILQYCYFTLRK